MNILITGASNGIGYQTALKLLENSSNRVIAISRNAEKLEQLRNEAALINQASGLCTFSCDISNESDVKKLSSELKSQFKSLHVLINNAGILIHNSFEKLTSEDWLRIYSTNVFGVVNVIKHLEPLVESGAHIVNISSMGGFQGSKKFAGLSAYSSSKAALVGITECLAEEFSSRCISVNCLCLGSVDTEMFNAAFPHHKAASTAKEIAGFISNFALEGGKFFNGKIIPVSVSTP